MPLLFKIPTLQPRTPRATIRLLFLFLLACYMYVLYKSESCRSAGFAKEENLIVTTPFSSTAAVGTTDTTLTTNASSAPSTTVKKVGEEGRSNAVVAPEPSIAVVCCTKVPVNELRVFLKSALIFGQDANVTVRILADAECQSELEPIFSELKEGVKNLNASFHWKILPAEAPVNITSMEERSGRNHCTAIRLFLPDILTEVDSTLYLDLDTIILSNLTEIWLDFEKDQRQSPHAVLRVTDHVPRPARSDYAEWKWVPFYGHSGINAGVIFMNLTRMRALSFPQLAQDAFDRYKDSLVYLDQDILNIVLSEHPSNASLMDCTYNFNPTNCGWSCLGDTPEEKQACFCWYSHQVGVKIIHGFAQTFINDNLPFFRHIFEKFLEMKIDRSHPLEVITQLSNDFLQLPKSTCFSLTKDALYSNALKYLETFRPGDSGQKLTTQGEMVTTTSPQHRDHTASSPLLEFINSVAMEHLSLQKTLDCTNAAQEAVTYCSQLEQHRFNFSQRANSTLLTKTGGGISPGMTINIAAVACEERGREEVIVMLKSALLVGQDCHVHVHVFTDNRTAPLLGIDLMELKWTAEVLDWHFTFTMHLEWFPAGGPWREMWQPCATQRLFFPSLLPHVDAVLYIDTDMIVLTNITELWSVFEKMDETELAAVAPNSEAPSDDPERHYPTRGIPFYGKRGLNAGFMLMNLTRMRRVDMQARALMAYQLFKEKIELADQDLYNIIFNGFPEWIHPIDCTYNFYWRHCEEPANETNCVQGDYWGERNCFCHPTLTDGVRIIHGNMGGFHSDGFLKDIYEEYKALDLLALNSTGLIEQLQHKFDSSSASPPCSHLTSAILYRNVLLFLQNL